MKIDDNKLDFLQVQRELKGINDDQTNDCLGTVSACKSGTMKIAGKKKCHDPKRHLEFNFPVVTEKLAPKLTVIDGIYVLEKGSAL